MRKTQDNPSAIEAESILRHGPNRVLIDEHGTAVAPLCARQMGLGPKKGDVIVIRRDGWTLAAPAHLAESAKDIWSSDLVGYMVCPARKIYPMYKWDMRDLIADAAASVTSDISESN